MPSEVDRVLATSGLGAAETRSFNSVLPTLFRESVDAVQKVQGRAGVDALLRDWRTLQEELKAEAPQAGRSAIEAKLAEIHAEELHIVHRVLGNRAITQLVTETNVRLAAARVTINAAAGAGHDVTRARAIAQQVSDKLSATTRAISVKDMPQALDRAADAAGVLIALRHHLIELERIEGLETLFPRALAKVREQGGDGAATVLTAKLERLNANTRAALRSGDREETHRSLAVTRAEQIRIVEQVLGQTAAAKLVYAVDNRAEEIEASLEALEQAGRDIVKQQRMLREAVDLTQRANAALQRGDRATALDLGSHAAGLLNTLQHLTWY